MLQGLAIAGFASFVGLCRAGGGRHANKLSPQEQSDFKLFSVLIGLCCVTGICLVKISVGFFLRRFLQARLLRRLVNGFIAFMVVYMVYSILTFALICMPLATYWDSSITTGTCWSARTMKIIGNLNAGKSLLGTSPVSNYLDADLKTWTLLSFERHNRCLYMALAAAGDLQVASQPEDEDVPCHNHVLRPAVRSPRYPE